MHISRKVRTAEALLLGVLLFTGGCVSPSKPRLSTSAQAEALSHFSLGLLAEAGGDSAAALNQLESAIRLDPEEEKLYAPAVAVALKLEQTDTAVGLAKKLAKRYPESAVSQLLLARVYTLTGRPDQAEVLFKKAWQDFPENPDTPSFLARFYLSQNRRGEALEVLRESLPAHSRNAGLLYLTGTLCIDRARDTDDAVQAKAAVEEGIGFLKQSLEIDPQDPLRWQQTGLALMAVRQPEEALEAFQEARLYAPSDITLARQMFELLIETGRYDEAINIYDHLADETGTGPELWLQYLAEKMPEKDHGRLTGHLEEQLREQPQAPAFYYAQLGSLYLGANKYEEAGELLLRALEQYPDDSRLRTVLGYLHLQKNRYDEAYAALDQVRMQTPETEWPANPFFLFNFLVAAQKSGHLEQAAEILTSTYTDHPEVLSGYMISLLTEPSPVSTENAIELLTAFRTLRPESAEALYYLMMVQAEQKEYRKAIETAQQFESLVHKNGDTNLLSGQFYYQYAALHERTGQLETAEKLFFKVIEMDEEPLAAAARNYIAYMWAERGEKLDTGLKLVQESLNVDPQNSAFLDTLGWIYYMQGRYAEALTELKKAGALAAEDPTIWEHLGDTYLKLGDRNKAIEHWEKALELDPQAEHIIERLELNGIRRDGHRQPADTPGDTMPRP